MNSPSMLTTVDNPFNPFTQFDDWYSFDEQKGYHTTSYLARIAKTSCDLSELDYSQAVEDAINEIIEENVLGIYRKYNKDNYEAIEDRTLSTNEEECLNILNGN